MEGFRKRLKLEHWRIISLLLVLYDLVAIHLAYFLALWGRFDFTYSQIPSDYLSRYQGFITIYALFCVIVFWVFRLYRSMWRFASYSELVRTLIASFLTSIVHGVAMTAVFGSMPLSYYTGGLLLQFVLLIAARFSFRFILFLRSWFNNREEKGARVMIIGAGNAGQMIIRDMIAAEETSDKPVCVIDDNPNKWNRFIEGVKIVGGRDDILASVEKYHVNKIYIAIPSASAEDRRNIINICNETGCDLKILPGMYQFMLGQVTVSSMKEVSVEDLLGREPIKADLHEVFDFIRDKTVLVTGGGGSIGSELCRQIAGHKPRRLIVFDIYENNAYSLQLELKHKYPELDLVVLIGSVRDSRRINKVFAEYGPQVVYHAAAPKHVPLMEDSPNEAIKNNVVGTYKTAYAAMLHGCERFVLISTDKAVNPTNIMGASKRLCEMVIQSFNYMIRKGRVGEIPQLFTHAGTEDEDGGASDADLSDVHTEFVAVRFGNVLGSNGSVIPVFKKQIEEGGPVTVTHPDIIRYFMTIQEAVSLVLLAGTYAHGGEIFVLDMGSPVKIDTLARNIIKLSGYRPDVDIKIVYTGLRPGEKLYEEKLMNEEGLKTTANELIFIGSPIPFDTVRFLEQLDPLMTAAYNNKENIRELVADIVSTYHPYPQNDEKKEPIMAG